MLCYIRKVYTVTTPSANRHFFLHFTVQLLHVSASLCDVNHSFIIFKWLMSNARLTWINPKNVKRKILNCPMMAETCSSHTVQEIKNSSAQTVNTTLITVKFTHQQRHFY